MDRVGRAEPRINFFDTHRLHSNANECKKKREILWRILALAQKSISGKPLIKKRLAVNSAC
jgi:hypothetical protein